jgi:ectoine hydroxylase-related dioxygenase (phytanoyl-CoA dioxygenase family)
MSATREQQLRAALSKFNLSGSALAQQARNAEDPNYWIDLNPQLTISSAGSADWDSEVSGSVGDKLEEGLKSYRQYGFLALDGVLSQRQIATMRDAVARLQAAEWPPVFAFVYDPFWCIGRARVVSALLKELLGSPQMLPRVWTHHVYTSVQNAGWRPHLDGRTGAPLTMSLWIPLTNATLRNGCMQLVKRNSATDELCRRYHTTDAFSREEVQALLTNTRALPCARGGLLAWDHNILHWGSYFECGSEPRVSIALEFASASSAEVTAAEHPSQEHDLLPGFSTRLEAIGGAILKYRNFEPGMERFASLAELLTRKRTLSAAMAMAG